MLENKMWVDSKQSCDFMSRLKTEPQVRFVAFYDTRHAAQLQQSEKWRIEAAVTFRSVKGPFHMVFILFQEDFFLKEKFTQILSTLRFEQFLVTFSRDSNYCQLREIAVNISTVYSPT